jgi:hypothetical protein
VYFTQRRKLFQLCQQRREPHYPPRLRPIVIHSDGCPDNLPALPAMVIIGPIIHIIGIADPYG